MRLGQSRRNLGETRKVIGPALERFLQLAARDQRGLDIQQLLRIEHAAARRQVRSRADIVGATDADVVMGREQPAGFAGLFQPGEGQVIGVGRFELARQRHRGGEIAETGQPLENLRVFENVQSFRVHRRLL